MDWAVEMGMKKEHRKEGTTDDEMKKMKWERMEEWKSIKKKEHEMKYWGKFFPSSLLLPGINWNDWELDGRG